VLGAYHTILIFKNNQMTKEERIQESYGKYWDSLSIPAKNCAIKYNGYIAPIISGLGEIQRDFVTFDDLGFRPISIIGIENNNGWVKIYCENDMPQFDCDCFIIDKVKGIVTGQWKQAPNEIEDKKARAFWMDKATHYKIISEPKLPIY
jgi:hypothetical protein